MLHNEVDIIFDIRGVAFVGVMHFFCQRSTRYYLLHGKLVELRCGDGGGRVGKTQWPLQVKYLSQK